MRDAAIRVASRRLYVARFWRAIWLAFIAIPLLAAGPGLVLGTRHSNLDPEFWIALTEVLGLTVAAWHASLSIEHRLQTLRQAHTQSPFDVATSSVPRRYQSPHDEA